MTSPINPFDGLFKNLSSLQRAIVAKLNIERHKRYASLEHFSSTMEATAAWYAARKACTEGEDALDIDDICKAESEMVELVNVAVELWPIGSSAECSIYRLTLHLAAVEAVINAAKSYGFSEREGYFLAHPWPAEVSGI